MMLFPSPAFVAPLNASPGGVAFAGLPRSGSSMPSSIANAMGQMNGAGKENNNVQVVQKKGDVVVWGPLKSQDGENTRLPRIICYGDSNTVGYCHEGRKFQPYGKSLASKLASAGKPCEVAVCGLCSYTTHDMLKEQNSSCVRPQLGPSGRGLKRMLEEDGPVDLVIIMTGTNDLGLQTNLRTIVRHVAQLHSICHEKGIPTIAIAATQGSGLQCRALRQQLADLIAKWASAATGVLGFLDVEDILPRPVGKDGRSNNPAAAAYWEHDDLHLSAAGSILFGRRLASHAAAWLQKLAAGGFELPKAKPRATNMPSFVPPSKSFAPPAKSFAPAAFGGSGPPTARLSQRQPGHSTALLPVAMVAQNPVMLCR